MSDQTAPPAEGETPAAGQEPAAEEKAPETPAKGKAAKKKETETPTGDLTEAERAELEQYRRDAAMEAELPQDLRAVVEYVRDYSKKGDVDALARAESHLRGALRKLSR